jgi:hypothetical protein
VNEKEDVVQFMEKKTKFLEDAHEVGKELIHLKEKKINIENERMRREDEREYERMRREDKKIRIKEESLCLKRMKEDERVMMVDTLSARQQAYYEQ